VTEEPRVGEDGRGVADELAAVLGDEALWMAVGSSHVVEQRDELAHRALRLYGLTSPILARRVREFATPCDYAVGALRDVGDACAILSRDWPGEDRPNLMVPARAEIETGIRRFGVFDWASSLGVELALTEPEQLEPASESGSTMEGLEGSLSASELAKRWGSTIRTFRAAAQLRRGDGQARANLQGSEARDAAAGMVALARVWLTWARQFSETAMIAVGVTQLFAAQGFFVACWGREPEGEPFPGDDYLREALAQDGGIEWLAEHAAEVPPELSA
jgi:hypothetical protein